MEKLLKEIGKIVKYRAKENIAIVTAEFIMDNFKMVRNMVKVK